jgi:hypothetical protein
VIRRGFWLTAGAVLGIAGYRQARQLGKALTGRSRPALAGKQSALLAPRRALPGRWQPATLAGRHSAPAARRSALAARRSATNGGRPARAAGRGLGGLAFVRDVREGMAEYRVRHNGTAGSTLGSQDRGGAEEIVRPGQQRWARHDSEQDRLAP